VEPTKAAETEYSPEFAATAQRYEQAVSEEPNNPLLLGNFAQFLYLVQQDHDR
jgi:Tfp pilus assembly protein PilF